MVLYIVPYVATCLIEPFSYEWETVIFTARLPQGYYWIFECFYRYYFTDAVRYIRYVSQSYENDLIVIIHYNVAVPRLVRADHGTENVNIEVLQQYFHDDNGESFRYGKSVANQVSLSKEGGGRGYSESFYTGLRVCSARTPNHLPFHTVNLGKSYFFRVAKFEKIAAFTFQISKSGKKNQISFT